jgi:hypothetical protein
MANVSSAENLFASMLIFSVKNAVLLALMQVGVIVAGVLAAATTSKLRSMWDITPPDGTEAFASYGVFLFLVPLAWITLALRLRGATDISDRAKAATFLSGIGLLVLLLVYIWSSVVQPFLRVCFFTIGG